ncbi:hypothetical protein AC249_AIPGENE11745 [Exaiptasia diaphana]|nr:hypothetical protein AC249_AIPGENE11745 [Exaiptasia diaphana]
MYNVIAELEGWDKRYLDYTSHHPSSHKAAVVRTLVHRKENLLSDDDVKQAEHDHLTTALLENGYPSSFLERHSISPKNNKITDEEPSQPKGFATLPYVKGTTERIRKVLTANNIKCCMRPEVTLRHVLSHPKDRVVADKKAGIVYSIPCGECDVKYIGETGRSLKTRRSEHISAVRHLNAKKSALAEHANNTGHSIDWAATSVVATETKSQQRKWLEACQIAKGKNILFNRDKDIEETQIWDSPNDTREVALYVETKNGKVEGPQHAPFVLPHRWTYDTLKSCIEDYVINRLKIDAKLKCIYYKKSGKSRQVVAIKSDHDIPALLAEYPLKTKGGKLSRKAMMVMAVDLEMDGMTATKTPDKPKLHFDLTDDGNNITPRRSPRLMAIRSSTNTCKEKQQTSKCIDLFLFEVSKTNKGEPKLSKTASVLHDISPDVTLEELKCLLRQSETSGSVMFAPSAGLYWLRKGSKQMVELKTDNDFFSCKEEYKDATKDKKLSCIRIACAAIDLNGTFTGNRSAVDRPAQRGLEYSQQSIEAREQQLVQAASKVPDTKTSNDIWNDVHCDLGKSAGVGEEPNWEEYIDLIGVPPKKRRERSGSAAESPETSTDDLLKAMMIQNQRSTEVFQTSLLAILANQQVQSPMFTDKISPQLTSTPIFMSSAKVPNATLADSSSPVKRCYEEKKDIAAYSHVEVINFLDDNNLHLFVPKFVEAEVDGPLLASLCHPYLGASILQGMGIGGEDGEAIVEAIRKEMKQ